MKRLAVFVYGVISYVIFLAVFVYAAGFVGNMHVPKSIDSGRMTSLAGALATDTLLLAVSVLPHSFMSRRWFRRAITRMIPEAAERSTRVLAGSLAVVALFWFWEPIGGELWTVESRVGQTIANGIFLAGYVIVLAGCLRTDYFDLFGLRQTRRHGAHPLCLGLLLFFWSTPVMTAAHFLLAAMSTAWIVVEIQLEERDMTAAHDDRYCRYHRARLRVSGN